MDVATEGGLEAKGKLGVHGPYTSYYAKNKH